VIVEPLEGLAKVGHVLVRVGGELLRVRLRSQEHDFTYISLKNAERTAYTT